MKKPRQDAEAFHFSAEKEGFEPPVPFGTTVFKTAALNRSAISPVQNYDSFSKLETVLHRRFKKNRYDGEWFP